MIKNKKVNIIQLLKQLTSIEAKYNALIRLNTRKRAIPKEYASEVVDALEAAEKMSDAAYLAEHCGLYERAIEINVKRGLSYFERGFSDHYNPLRHAADIAIKAGLTEKVIELIGLLEEKGDFGHAGGCAIKIGLTERGIDDYEKAGALETNQAQKREWFDGAAYYALKSGDFDRAIDNYEKSGQYFFAGDRVIKFGSSTIIDGLMARYEKEGRFLVVARMARKLGLKERALDNYDKIKSGLSEGAEYAESIGLTEKAIALYEKAGNTVDGVGGYPFTGAAKLAEKIGNFDRAIDNYAKVGQFGKAAEVAKKAGLTEKSQYYATLEEFMRH